MPQNEASDKGLPVHWLPLIQQIWNCLADIILLITKNILFDKTSYHLLPYQDSHYAYIVSGHISSIYNEKETILDVQKLLVIAQWSFVSSGLNSGI